ncbi:MAG: PaaI family thioesterase [Pseudomonadota bacterium]
MSELEANVEQRQALLQNEGNPCFVCGPANPIGLKVQFRMEQVDEELVCLGEFTPQPVHMGYKNVTHGGIVFSLLDDVMANWIWLQGEQCFTGKADIRYRSELPVGTPVRLEGRCTKRKGRMAQMTGQVIRQADDFVVAEATAAFMIPPSDSEQ